MLKQNEIEYWDNLNKEIELPEGWVINIDPETFNVSELSDKELVLFYKSCGAAKDIPEVYKDKICNEYRDRCMKGVPNVNSTS